MLNLAVTPEEQEFYEHFRSQIGKEFEPTKTLEVINRGDPAVADCIYFFRWGAEADYSFIKKWCVANEDFNALYWDEEYAKNSRWGEIVAPPMYAVAANDGMEWSFEGFIYAHTPGRNLVNHLRALEADTEWEFFEPIRPGDVITSTNRLADVYWKEGKAGRLMFIFGETELWNQKGQLVARNRTGACHVFKRV
jgi:hypothetical protein